MINSFIISFCLLFTCSVLVNYVLYLPLLQKRALHKLRQILLGILVGVTCVLLMVNAYKLSDNVLLSFYHIPITYVALYYSPWVSLHTVAAAAVGRYFFYGEELSSAVGCLDILVMGIAIAASTYILRKTFPMFMILSTVYTLQNMVIIYVLIDGDWSGTQGVLYLTACVLAAFLLYYVVNRIQQFFVMNKRYEEQAKIDGLTGVYNRYELEQHLEYLTLTRRSFAVMMIDIDNFKAFNDENGHQAGDQALIETAGHVNEVIREQGSVYRYGGEEFVVILENQMEPSLKLLADALLKRMQEHRIRLTAREMREMTVSIGIASSSEDTTSSNDVLRKADNAMYKAKTSGKNKAVYYQQFS